MDEMIIEIISKENIKPSSPTPQNLQNYKVSLLDQILPHFNFPMILYFPTNNNTNVEQFISESTKTLKQSLSKLLTRFYPFAGRFKDPPLSIDCNDEGFLFVVSKIKSNLADFLNKPDHKAILRLLPGTSPELLANVVMMVQVNYFECGGMAIAFLFSHTVADGVTMSYFLKSWSQYAYNSVNNNIDNISNGRVSKEAMCPSYMLNGLFPGNEALPVDYYYLSMILKTHVIIGKTVMRRYVFDSRAISTLKSKLPSSCRTSRLDVVSAFLWKCFIVSAPNNNNLENFLVLESVNMRRKVDPPLPENCFGNFVWIAKATTTRINNEDEDNEKDYHLEKLVRKLRDAISKVDDEFIMRMHGDEGVSGYCKNVDDDEAHVLRGTNSNEDEDNDQEESGGDAEILGVTSWCNFGLYKLDFGWGKPIWINNCSGGNDAEAPYSNLVFLIDTRNGDGVEACVTLEERHMRAFDDIEELKALASVDPSPFDIS